ncbi:MAG TPA: META domain-containing protein [Galbitalea sp.]|nr:META domain-containing protein [Galbitalea sp.]
MRTTARFGAVVAALVVAALLLAGCSSPRDEGGPDPAMRGQWELISATDGAGPISLANQLISLTIAGDNTTAGRSTCSDYTARVYGTQENLWITTTLPRAEHCGIQAQQDIEQRYIADLNRVRSSTVVGGVLDLLAPGVDLRYQRALAVPLGLVVDRTWNLATVSADSYYATANPTPVPQKGASIHLTRNGELGGTTGCRRFTAKYTENAGEIVISKFSYQLHGRCTENDEAADTYVISVIEAGFTFISGIGQLSVSSPRAEISLGFVD